MGDFTPALFGRLEAAAQRQHCTIAELLEQWLANTEDDRAISAYKAGEEGRPDRVGVLTTTTLTNGTESLPDAAEREPLKIDATLIESEQRLRIISEMTSDYAYSFRVLPDLTLKLEWVTVHAFQRITEFAPEEVTQNGGWNSLLHPDDRAETERTVMQFLTIAMEMEFEYRIITKSGAIRYILAVNKSVTDASGRIDHVYGTANDITARKMAQLALEASETRSRIISELSSDYALAVQVLPDGRVKREWCTEASFHKMTGYTAEEADAHGWIEIAHPADRPTIEALLMQLLPVGGVNHIDHRMISKDGSIRYVTAAYHVVADSAGRISRLYISVTDITDRKHYEDALRESEQRYRMLADNVIDTIVSVDEQNNVTYISPSVERLLGYSPEEFMGHSPIDWVDPAQLDELYIRWKDLLAQSGGFQHSEYRMRHKSGHYVWIETLSQIDASPAVSVWRNISERKQAEQMQQEAENRFSAVFHNSPISISLRAMNQGDYVEVNDAFVRLFGYNREEVLSGAVQSADLWIDPEERAEFSRLRAEHNQVTQFEHRLRKKSGELSTALVSSVVVDIKGEPYSITFGQDIAERKKAEQLQREAESRFTTVFYNSPVAITLRNRVTGQLLAVNDAFVNLVGYSREALINGQFKIADLWSSEEDRTAYRRERIEQNPIRQVEHRLRTKTGELIDVLMSSAIVEINDEPVSITFTQNITDLKQAEHIQRERDQLRIALEKEHEVNQIANQVIRTISHEFRTPLATIRSAAFTIGRISGDLSDPVNSEKRDKRLHVIDNQVTVLDHLIDDISLLIRNLSGQLPFDPTEMNLEVLCRASIEEMQETLGMRHLLLFEMKGAVQTVTADKKLLERVLINLLSNAIKYSAPGTTICLTLSQERDQAVIRIIDQGWGIAPADLELLFTPYFRTDEAQGVSGVGLGLSIVRECVARHHGRIAVQSELDQGTTFTIYLPLRQQIDPDNGLTP